MSCKTKYMIFVQRTRITYVPRLNNYATFDEVESSEFRYGDVINKFYKFNTNWFNSFYVLDCINRRLKIIH